MLPGWLSLLSNQQGKKSRGHYKQMQPTTQILMPDSQRQFSMHTCNQAHTHIARQHLTSRWRCRRASSGAAAQAHRAKDRASSSLALRASGCDNPLRCRAGVLRALGGCSSQPTNRARDTSHRSSRSASSATCSMDRTRSQQHAHVNRTVTVSQAHMRRLKLSSHTITKPAPHQQMALPPRQLRCRCPNPPCQGPNQQQPCPACQRM
jgi:hypothetical protein